MGNNFQYHGTLEETSLPDMLATIFRHKVPGRIEISRDRIVKQIYINEGNVIHASSTDRADRLGAYLYRLGRLSREELAETMRVCDRKGQRHSHLLIERGLLSPGELYEAIRGQMESIVWSVFSWQKGEVTFGIGGFKDPITVKIHLPMRQVIIRGIKQVTDTKSLVARLGNKTTVFRPTYGLDDLIEIALTTEEFQLLRLIDGKRRFFDVCNEGPYSVSENARLIYAFCVLGLVEKVDEAGASGVIVRINTDKPS
ncbi:MAG: DUF4388 domain-containing protein [bacterium]|nr:DUF4388 domain-containing protein [bacterium]